MNLGVKDKTLTFPIWNNYLLNRKQINSLLNDSLIFYVVGWIFDSMYCKSATTRSTCVEKLMEIYGVQQERASGSRARRCQVSDRNIREKDGGYGPACCRLIDPSSLSVPSLHVSYSPKRRGLQSSQVPAKFLSASSVLHLTVILLKYCPFKKRREKKIARE